MKIIELEGSQFSTKDGAKGIKESEQQLIEKQIADFTKTGGRIESIPRGMSGNTYTSRPLTAKQSREKLKLALKSQPGGTI